MKIREYDKEIREYDKASEAGVILLAHSASCGYTREEIDTVREADGHIFRLSGNESYKKNNSCRKSSSSKFSPHAGPGRLPHLR